jgi:competence/damage-inducible protein CinA-like protein
MSGPPRAGIIVTGTEVLSGRVQDRNGPWLAERLAELGVDLAYVTIVGDRPDDIERALAFMAGQKIDLVLTSGGLGPTADDLTAEIVGRFQGRGMVLDEGLRDRIEAIVTPLRERMPNLDPQALQRGTRKQATIPDGASVLEPVGTAPGLIVPPLGNGDGRPTVLVLPGPPRELQPMWSAALQTPALQAPIAGATVYEQRTLRLFGIPESEIARTLRDAQSDGIELDRLEITTCLKRGEIEVVTRYEPDATDSYRALERFIGERHADTLFSSDGATIDEQVADLLRGIGSHPPRPTWTIAVAESCTGGGLLARLTAPAGASEYVLGGAVAYANRAKIALAGVDPELIERYGAVSGQVARALAEGARSRLGSDVGVGITGVAGPGGGSEQKPVGLVWLSAAGPEGVNLTRSVKLPGSREDVRDRASTVALHLVRRLLLGERED